jgi:transcriptional regulator with XRE-family HTH domain
MFNITRLELARKRRRYTARALAERANIAPVTLSRIVNGQQIADEMTIEKLVDALQFQRSFFSRTTSIQ